MINKRESAKPYILEVLRKAHGPLRPKAVRWYVQQKTPFDMCDGTVSEAILDLKYEGLIHRYRRQGYVAVETVALYTQAVEQILQSTGRIELADLVRAVSKRIGDYASQDMVKDAADRLLRQRKVDEREGVYTHPTYAAMFS